jgi:membrane protein
VGESPRGEEGSGPRSGPEPSSPRPEPPPEGSAPADPSSRSTRERIAELRTRADVLEGQARDRFEQERSRRGWIQIGYDAWDLDRHRGGPLLSGGIAYRIFLFELPFLLFIISLFGVVADLSGEDPEQVAHDSGLSAAMATTIAKAVNESGSARWWLLLLGGWLTVWAARSGVRALNLTSTIAWGLPLGVARTTVRATGIFIAILFGGFALQVLAPELFGGDLGLDLLVFVLISAVTFALCLLAMRCLPHRGSPWRPVIPGSILLAVGVRVLSIVNDLYFAGRVGRVDDLYGGLGIAIVILLYLYLLARLFVAGQFLNARIGGVSFEPRTQAA